MKHTLSLLCVCSALFATPALAEGYTISLTNKGFQPADLIIPTGEKVKITIKNETIVAAEFESNELRREKVVSAGSQADIFVGPLEAGTYSYMNEFQQGVTGTITAKVPEKTKATPPAR